MSHATLQPDVLEASIKPPDQMTARSPGEFQPVPRPTASTPAPQADDRIKILIVDDVPGKLVAHEAVLQDLGETVMTACSGREALEQLLKHDFAVILLDVNMPDMDGFETAAMIRHRPRYEHTPIIFITACNTTDLDR